MKKRAILDRQAVSRRRPKDYTLFFRAFKAISIMSMKIFGLCMVAVSISVFFYLPLPVSDYLSLCKA